MLKEVPAGTYTRTWTVTREMTTHRGGFDILSSPALMQSVETSAKEYLGPVLPPGWDSVGTYFELRHQAPVAEGQEFTVTLHSAESDGSRFSFTCEVTAVDATLAEARHDRVPIDLERYARRLSRVLGTRTEKE